MEEVPAAISQGETLGEAKANLLDALKLVLECQRELVEKDLTHKLSDARRLAGGQVRTLCQPKPAVRLVWKIEPKAAKAVALATMQAPRKQPQVKPQKTLPPKPETIVHLSNECLPWLHVARQILADKFRGADRSTVDSLTIGLGGIAHRDSRCALEWLQNQAKRQQTYPGLRP